MAMRVPCITSELANNALGATNAENILIGKNAEEFAQLCLQLLSNRENANEIADRGYAFVSQNYNWESCTKKLEKLFFKSKDN